MTKQKGIRRSVVREGIASLLRPWMGDPEGSSDDILSYLHSQGVVLKVNRELPHPWRNDCMSANSETCKTCDNCELLEWAQFDLIEAVYVATESLLEE